MNFSATTPLDPWLSILPSALSSSSAPTPREMFVPPELLDFLLRAGVVKEHPKDGGRVRLVDFGRGVGVGVGM